MCLCCAMALQFPQRVVALFQKKTSISKPELFYWNLCLVSQESAIFTPCIVILITVTAITGVCTWVGHPAWAITIDRWSTPVRHVSRITWHPPRKSVVSEYLRVITLLLFKLFTVRRDAGEIGQLRETRSSVENGPWVAPWAFISCHMFSTLTMVTNDCHVNSIFVCYITVHWESFLTSLAIWINDVISTFCCRVTLL